LGGYVELLALVSLGYALRRVGVLDETSSSHLNAFVVYAAMPALVYKVTSSIPVHELVGYGEMTLVSIATASVSTALAAGIARLLREEDPLVPILCSSLGNTGFLGYPICLSTFGEEGLRAAVFYDFGTVLCVIAAYAIAGRGNPIKVSLRFPPAHAAVAGMLTSILSVKLPTQAVSILKDLGGAAVPTIMVSLGAALKWRISEWTTMVPAAWTIKLGISPLVALTLAHALGLEGVKAYVATVEGAMPPAVMTVVLSELLGRRVDLAASITFSATVISLMTVPLVILMVTGRIPAIT